MITDTTGLYAIHYYMMQSSSQRGPETLGSKGVAKKPKPSSDSCLAAGHGLISQNSQAF